MKKNWPLHILAQNECQDQKLAYKSLLITKKDRDKWGTREKNREKSTKGQADRKTPKERKNLLNISDNLDWVICQTRKASCYLYINSLSALLYNLQDKNVKYIFSKLFE